MYPSLDSAKPVITTGKGTICSFVIKNRPAPSPNVIPLLLALNGFVGSGLTADSDIKPAEIKSLAKSIPPTSIASAAPLSIKSIPLITEDTPDAQAAATLKTGPFRPKIEASLSAGT